MLYAGIQQFDSSDGERWSDFVQWIGRLDFQRVVTLDCELCPTLVRIESDADWQHVIREDYMLDFFSDFSFVIARAARFQRALVIAAAREPSEADVSSFAQDQFEFAGFDVVDHTGDFSALLGEDSPKVFSRSELSAASGLIPDRKRAFEIRDSLRDSPSSSGYENFYVWALWRYTATI